LDVLVRRALLYDFYGLALRERQRKAYQLHYLEDLSLAECAEELSCSRPAALLLVRRAEKTLEELETAIGSIAQHEREVSLWQNVSVAAERRDLDRVREIAIDRLKELAADV
jgi:predicted DNA-binding protein YlxM (UPF0122 family)